MSVLDNKCTSSMLKETYVTEFSKILCITFRTELLKELFSLEFDIYAAYYFNT